MHTWVVVGKKMDDMCMVMKVCRALPGCGVPDHLSLNNPLSVGGGRQEDG